MKLISLKCPECSASLEIKEGIDTFFCTYCGTKIQIDEMSKEAYKAGVKLKEFEHEEKMLEKNLEHEKYILNSNEEKEKRESKTGIRIALGSVILFILMYGMLYYFFVGGPKAEMKKIEKQLVTAISSNDYDMALILANQLYYTGDSRDDKAAWNAKRENYISIIMDKQREKNKGSIEYISIPLSSEEMKGQDANSIAEMLRNTGFNNVTTTKSNENKGIFTKNMSVEHVTVYGKEIFGKGDTFDKSSPIIIYYYSK